METVNAGERKYRLNKILDICNPVLAVIIAFVVSGLMVVISGSNPIDAYVALAKGAFGSAVAIKTTLRYAWPTLLLAMSFSMCSRSGYFNIGQEGQMYAAAVAVCWLQFLGSGLPKPLLAVLMLLGGMLAGAVMSFLPAYFKHLLGINEVVIAILLNYLMLKLCEYMLTYTPIASTAASVPMSIDLGPTFSNVMLLVGVGAIVVVYAVFMRQSVPGFRLRMAGNSELFARSNGIKTAGILMVVALLGGALSGITATGEMLGVYHKMYRAYADGMGFTGMTAALIGRHSPLGMVLGALLLGALQSGAVNLSVTTDVPPEIVLVVRGFVMLFAAVSILQLFIREKRVKTAKEAE